MQLQSWTRRTFALSAAFLVGLGLVVSVSPEANARHHRKHARRQVSTVVTVASKDAELKTTVSAIKKAGLVHALSSKGPFTAFLPSDAGWDKLTKENRESLLNDPKRLAEVLKYHVVKGKYSAADLAERRSLVTLQGESLMLDNKDGTVIVDGCIVTKGDVKAGNGMIHVIDYVATPERGK